jgi:hypothetical protein
MFSTLATIFLSNLVILPNALAQLTQEIAQASNSTAPCPQPAQFYSEQFATTKKVLDMVCYQYAVQRDPDSVGATPPDLPLDPKKLVDVFGRKVRDKKQIFDEIWRPLPGFNKLYYDTQTLSRFYPNGRPMLQIAGTSTLGTNPFKVAMTVDCTGLKLSYDAVAHRHTRIYDYDEKYRLAGDFPTEQIQELCDGLSDRPVQISP